MIVVQKQTLNDYLAKNSVKTVCMLLVSRVVDVVGSFHNQLVTPPTPSHVAKATLRMR